MASWNWYFPHHYAPMVSDMTDIAGVDISFDYGEPFRPFEQLLAVLPSASHKLLPVPFTVRLFDPGISANRLCGTGVCVVCSKATPSCVRN